MDKGEEEEENDKEEKEEANTNGDDSESEDEVTYALAAHDNGSQSNEAESHKKKPPVIKYGPPTSKQKQIHLPTQHPTHSGQVAGPSSIPLKPAPKAGKASKSVTLQPKPAPARKQSLPKTRSDVNQVWLGK